MYCQSQDYVYYKFKNAVGSNYLFGNNTKILCLNIEQNPWIMTFGSNKYTTWIGVTRTDTNLTSFIRLLRCLLFTYFPSPFLRDSIQRPHARRVLNIYFNLDQSNAHANLCSESRSFWQRLLLSFYTAFSNSEGSGETAYLCIIDRTFAVRKALSHFLHVVAQMMMVAFGGASQNIW